MSDTFRLHFLHIDDQGSEVRTVRVSETDTIEDLCAKIEELGLEDPLRGYAPFRVGNMKVWQFHDDVRIGVDDEAKCAVVFRLAPSSFEGGIKTIATHLRFPTSAAQLRPRNDETDLVHFIVSSKPCKPDAQRGEVTSDLVVLNCLLYGEDANRICPIEMKRSANVHELRKAIKDERSSSFGYRIDAVHLMLWAVSFPITRNVGDMIVGASFLDEEKLLPVELLSHIFPNQPPRDCIHVVIKFATLL